MEGSEEKDGRTFHSGVWYALCLCALRMHGLPDGYYICAVCPVLVHLQGYTIGVTSPAQVTMEGHLVRVPSFVERVCLQVG